MGVLLSGERGEVMVEVMVVTEGVGERGRRGRLEVVMAAGARCSVVYVVVKGPFGGATRNGNSSSFISRCNTAMAPCLVLRVDG